MVSQNRRDTPALARSWHASMVEHFGDFVVGLSSLLHLASFLEFSRQESLLAAAPRPFLR
jgi:hypothetical protein